MTTATCCCASKAARRACCTARRSPSARRTISTSASMAKRAASSGTRTSRTRCSLKWLDQPMQVYRTANGYLGKAAARAPAAPRPRIPRATSKPSPTSTRTSPRTSAPASKAAKLAKDDLLPRLPEDRGRRPRHGLHRSRREIVQATTPPGRSSRCSPRQARRVSAARFRCSDGSMACTMVCSLRPRPRNSPTRRACSAGARRSSRCSQ